MNNYPAKVFLNDRILDHLDAKISVFDRAFLFGDSIYEVMVQINGKFFLKQEHLSRLSDCLDKVNINFDVDILPEKINHLLDLSGLKEKDCLLYIQVTRGIAPRKHRFPKNANPSLMMYALPFVLPDINQNQVSVVTVNDERWHRCDIKTTSLLGNVLANTCAAEQGAYEAVFIRDGKVTEASHCNIFFVKDNVVFTHPANTFILDGITRKAVINLCNELNLEVCEEAINADDIPNMDEAFLTGTTTQVASVRQIDDYFYYEDDNLGPITKKLQESFLELKNNNHPR
ncbi:MAG: aminotransferase class IV [Bacteroidia bacterium]|nr:aminotransferase class IV [Bacteroidia bacterium]